MLLQHVAVYYVLQRVVAVCCSVLQHLAGVKRQIGLSQCVAVFCCIVLQREVSPCRCVKTDLLWQCVAVRYSVSQCVEVFCCSVLQCEASPCRCVKTDRL